MSLYVDIHKKLGDFSLNVSFETGGECLGLLGASGCGKSITLRCIAGIITPDSGRIVLNDRVLFDSEKKINLPPQKRRVGYLFQNYALFPHMTVEQNIGIGVPKADLSRQQQIVDSYIEVFHLEDQRKLYPPQLSGGQQQRVALARILASAPEVLLLDEPFSALDEFLKEEMHFELQRTLDTYSGEVVMVTHSRDEVYRFCPELAVLVKGQIVDRGRMKELFDHPTKLATARLSGCKNISRAVREGDHLVNALDWGIQLYIPDPVPGNTSYVGLRAHDIHPLPAASEEAEGKEFFESDNRFTDQVGESSSGPFETDVRLENTGLWWKLDTKLWRSISAGRPVTEFRIDTSKLFLLEE